MAQAPSEQDIQKAQAETQAQIDAKRAEQQEHGKDFVIDDDGHAPGVIPEPIWEDHKVKEGEE